MAASMEVVVGTYEEMLVGYKFVKDKSAYHLEQSFTNHSHCGSVRAIAAAGRLLVSGSTDETVRVFNLRSRVEVGSLIAHEGSITSLQFYRTSHLLSGSDDGTVCVWHARSWERLKTLRGHEKGVTSVSVHPSGKIALSVSKDRTLRTWNLVKGRTAYVTNIKAVADIVAWSPDGSLYAVAVDKTLDVYSVQLAGVIHKIDFGKKILSLAFVTDTHVAIGGEGQDVEIHSADKSAIACIFRAHANRVKALCCLTPTPESNDRWLVSGSNDGYIRVWSLNTEKLSEDPQLLAEVNTTCRITCLTAILSQDSPQTNASAEEHTLGTDQDQVKRKKRKRKSSS